MNFKLERTVVIIGAIIIIALAIGLPFLTRPSENLLPNFALSQLAFSAVAFFIVFLALYFTIVQLRKSMAKPHIKVAFSNSGKQQDELIYYINGKTSQLSSLWLINDGNAIARYFQIDFIIPIDIGKPSQYVTLVRDNGNYILTYTNEGKYTLFVNRPFQDPNLIFPAAINKDKCIDIYRDSFKVEYRIFGDWGETQKGELKVNLIKQQEVT